MNTAVAKANQNAVSAPAERVELVIGEMAAKFRPLLADDEETARFCRVAVNAVQQTRDMDQVAATREGRESIYTACLQAATDRLVLDKKQSALVVYNVKGKDENGREVWRKEAKSMPMVQGLIHLAYEGGVVKKLCCQIVHAADGFGVSPSSSPPFVHNFPEDPFAKRGDIKGVYAVAQFHDGTWSDIEVLSVDDVESIRKRSKSPDKGPWVTDWKEMARKTAIRKLSKYLPKTGAEHFHSAVQRLDADIDLTATAIEGPKRKEMMAGKLLGPAQTAPAPEPKSQAAPIEAKKGAEAKQAERQKQEQTKKAAASKKPVQDDDDLAGFDERGGGDSGGSEDAGWADDSDV